MIYKNPKPYNEGKLMLGIFDYQHKLVKRYQEIGAVPNPMPIDINNRDHQKFIKSTMGDIIEELVEADSIYDPIKRSMNTEDLRELGSKIDEPLKQYTEELIDVVHFFIELFIAIGIDNAEINDYYEVMCKEQGIEILVVEDALITGMRYARHYLIKETTVTHCKRNSYKAINQKRYEQLHVGGYFLNPELIPYFDEFNWAITKRLKLAAHKLKKKAWRETELKTELRPFYTNVMEAWVCLTFLFDMIGLDEKGIYTQYEDKNIINQKRIETNY